MSHDQGLEDKHQCNM